MSTLFNSRLTRRAARVGDDAVDPATSAPRTGLRRHRVEDSLCLGEQLGYTGSHTNRAARIEPITPPGQVYASSAFAAVAAATGARGLSMRYVGRIPLAKGYGTLGLYSVRGTP